MMDFEWWIGGPPSRFAAAAGWADFEFWMVDGGFIQNSKLLIQNFAVRAVRCKSSGAFIRRMKEEV
jgi:hypothetical protein